MSPRTTSFPAPQRKIVEARRTKRNLNQRCRFPITVFWPSLMSHHASPENPSARTIRGADTCRRTGSAGLQASPLQAIPDGTPLACWLPVKPGLTVHGLRHGHKTWMADDGIPEILAEQRTGQPSTPLTRAAARRAARPATRREPRASRLDDTPRDTTAAPSTGRQDSRPSGLGMPPPGVGAVPADPPGFWPGPRASPRFPSVISRSPRLNSARAGRPGAPEACP